MKQKGTFFKIVFTILLVIGLMPVSGATARSAYATGPSPYMVKDINSGSGSSYPHGFIRLNGKLYFNASDAEHGAELWVTDGTSAGTQLLKDLLPGAAGSDPFSRGTKVIRGKIFFSTTNGLWVSDGTATGTVMLMALNSEEGVGSITPTDSLIFFVKSIGVYNDFDQCYYYHSQLWVTDGTLANTNMVKDFDTAYSTNWNGNLVNFSGVGNSLFFDVISFSSSYWRSDGTTSGTVETGIQNNIFINSPDRQPAILYKNRYYYGGRDGMLWSSDGTAAGTSKVADVSVDTYSNMLLFNGLLYFTAPGSTPTANLWKSDGTTLGTVIVKELADTWADVQRAGDQLIIILPFSLWKSDGTSDGTTKYFTFDSNFGTYFYHIQNRFIYLSRGGEAGRRIFRSDGTSGGTTVFELPPISTLANIGGSYCSIGFCTQFQLDNGLLFFIGDDGVHGSELWAIDTGEKPSLCDDIYEIPYSECEALVTFYQSTGGDNWKNKTNWFETNIPSNWAGVTVTDYKVTGISMPDNNLIGSFPTDLTKLKSLSILNLSHNDLSGTIPTQLSTLSLLYNPGGAPGGEDGLSLDYNQLLVDSPYPSSPATTLQIFLMQKDPNWQLTQGNFVQIPADGTQLNSADGRTEITVPGGAVSTGTTLEYLPSATTTPENDLGKFLFANTNFHLIAVNQDGTVPGTYAFTEPLVMKLSYTDTDVKGMNEGSLALYYWDTSSRQWKDASTTCSPVSTYIRDAVNNTLTVNVCHLTEFALVGDYYKSYLPNVMNNK